MSARKRVRAFLKARSTSVFAGGPSIAEYGGKVVTVPDLQELLHSEHGARKAAARAIHEKLRLQRKNAVYVQRLKDWDAVTPASLSRWKDLQNAAAVQSAKAAEATEKFRAAQAEAARRGAEVDRIRADLQAAWNQRDALLGTSDPQATEIRRLRAEVADKAQALDAASADAKNQRAEKIQAQRAWREMRKELATLRAAGGYHAMYCDTYTKLQDANRQNAELAKELTKHTESRNIRHTLEGLDLDISGLEQAAKLFKQAAEFLK